MKRGNESSEEEDERVAKRAALEEAEEEEEQEKEQEEEQQEQEEQDEDEKELSSESRKREASAESGVARKRSKSFDVDDPRSTSLYQASKSYYTSAHLERSSDMRRSGRRALSLQITRCGGEARFRSKLLRVFPAIRQRLKGGQLLDVPLEELISVVLQEYPAED